MEAFPNSERRQERRFNRKGVVMNIHRVLAVCCENKSKVGMEAFPHSERRQEHRFNRKGAQALVSFKKIYAPSSSLHLPFSPSPLRLNVLCLFVIL
jgi:hypothetical protein